MPTTTGVATSFIDFTRASNATVTDSDGRVKWAPANLLTNSESFDAASWTKSNLAVSANSVAAPNGTTTADLFTPNTTSGSHRVVGQTLPVATSLTFSCFVRANGYTKFGIRESDASGAGAAFNLSGSGSVIGVYDTAGGTVTDTSITALASNWFLISCKISFASNTQMSCGLYILSPSYTSGDLQVSWTPNGTDGVYVWGASAYRSDLAMQPNTSAYPMYNPTTPKNLLGYTENFGNAYWTNDATTITASATTAPNGLSTANKIVALATLAFHARYVVISLGSAVYTLSVYAKAAEYSLLHIGDRVGATYGAAFDLVSGTVVAGTTGGAKYVSSAITPVGNGWYRCSVVLSNPAGSVGPTFVGYPSGALVNGIGAQYTGDGTSGIYLWGAQLSDSASLDSYSPVYGAAVTSAAYYGPRRDFDGATLACKGLLVEEQRTNLQLNSNVFGTSTFATTVVAGAAASPSGLIDASSLACTSTTGRAILSTSVTSGVVYTFSVFIKAGTNTSAYIELAGTAGSGGPVVFNLSSGTVTSGTGGAIVPAPNGFYRCSVTSTATGTGASDMRIGTSDATSKTVFVYGAQLEAGSFATSYIPTGSANATRTADVASVSTQAFPYSSTEGTLVVAWQLAQLSGSPAAIHLTDAAESNRIRINAHLSGINRSTITAAGALVDNIDTSTAATGITKYALGGKSADYAVYRNGSAGGTSTNAGFPSGCTEMRIGRDAATGNFNGHIRQITYIPRRLANAELQTRTS